MIDGLNYDDAMGGATAAQSVMAEADRLAIKARDLAFKAQKMAIRAKKLAGRAQTLVRVAVDAHRLQLLQAEDYLRLHRQD